MLVARFSKAASSLVGATVKAPKSRMARKVSVKSSIFKVSNKYALPSFTKVHARTVTTFSDGLTAEEKAAIEVTDMRGLEQSVEFLTGVPQSQLHRNVTIYRPTPRTVQSGTKHTKVYMKFQRAALRVNEGLMGWTSTTDPTGNLTVSFPDEHSAIAFAQRNGFEFELSTPGGQDRAREPKDYAYNFRFRKSQHNENFDL